MTTAAPRSFAALAVKGYPAYLATFTLTMMADNIEHVISYWVAFQKFNSPALGGFAVISHWLPFLLFSVAVGALNDRFDSRRLIQAGGLLFVTASAGWSYFFVTDTLALWHTMVLLVIHGCAAVLWSTSSQVLLYDIVGPESLGSAVRLSATARYLGMVAGPGVGSVIMLLVGPTYGILLNTVFYIPLLVWLMRAPYGRHLRGRAPGTPPRARGSDILRTLREVLPVPALATMILLASAVSFFVGNSYHAQMPGFASQLGHGDPGLSYSMLLAADALGALLGGVLLEARGGIFTLSIRTSVLLAIGWAGALFVFAATRFYPLALVALFAAGFFELSFSSINQTLVQLNAPDAARGRVLGLYGMASNGLRTFSGITVGLLGGYFGIQLSLASAALAVMAAGGLLWWRLPRAAA